MKRTTTTTTDLKRINRNKVYRYIHEKGQVSKRDLVQALGLSLPTVSQNLSELFDMKLLHYAGTFESSGGRRSKKISAIVDARMVIGVEIKMNYINILAIDLKGNPLPNERHEIRFEISDAYGKFLAAGIENYILTNGLNAETILGVGISIPGVLSKDKREIISAPTLKTKQVPLEPMIRYIPFETFAENDANAGGYAELHIRKDLETLAYVSISEGVGGALVYNGTQYNGMNNRGIEIGHMTVVNGGKECNCGRTGCLEAYISTSVLSLGKGMPLSGFFEKLKEGDAECREIWEEYLTYLCIGINNIRTILDCDIILGGTLAGFIGDYFDDIKRRLRRIAVFDSDANYLHIGKFTSNEGAIGTALHFADQFVKNV